MDPKEHRCKRHIHLQCNKDPIASYKPNYLEKCYHIEKGSKRLDNTLLGEFEYTPKDLFPKWYREEKKFKYIPKSGDPKSSLRRPCQYLVAML
jgi:hypothetical protein